MRNFTYLLLFIMLPGFNTLYGQCVNADFEEGNFSGWTGTYGTDSCRSSILGSCYCYTIVPTQYTGFNIGPDNHSPADAIHQYSHVITTAGAIDSDLMTYGITLPTVWPGSGAYSVRLGNAWQQFNGGDGETMSYSFVVSPAYTFKYHYAAVLNDGQHPTGQQSYFSVTVVDSTGDTIPNTGLYIDANIAQTMTNFMPFTPTNIYFNAWSTVSVPLDNYVGQRVKITFTTSGCLPDSCTGSHYAYAYIDAECAQTDIMLTSAGRCASNGFTLTALPGAATYSWTGPAITSGTTDRSVTANHAGKYTVIMTNINGLPADTLNTFVAADVNGLSANFSYITSCADSLTYFKDISLPHDSIISWNWQYDNSPVINDSAENPSAHFATTGQHPVKLTITTAGCAADTTIWITVTPPGLTATFTTPETVCVGEEATVTFTGSALTGAVFNWNFDKGIASSTTGAGPIQVQWDSAGINNISLTVTQNGCAATFADTLNIQLCTSIDNIDAAGITVYPNPAKNDFTITTTAAIKNATLKIYDVLGQVIYTSQVINAPAGFSKQIHLNAATGVYLLLLNNGQKKFAQKIVLDGD